MAFGIARVLMPCYGTDRNPFQLSVLGLCKPVVGKAIEKDSGIARAYGYR